MLCGSLDGRGVWGRMDTCVYMAESFCCPLETIKTFLISYITILNDNKLGNFQMRGANHKLSIGVPVSAIED